MSVFRTLLRTALAFTAVAAVATDAAAQRPVPANVLSAGDVPGYEDLELRNLDSPFNLQAKGQEGSMGFRGTGQVSWCMNNVGIGMRGRFGCPGASIQYQRNPAGTFSTGYFDVGLLFAAPNTDLPHVIDPVASGLKGGGYTVNMVTTIIGGSIAGGGDKIWSSDRSGTDLLALGVKTTNDGGCTDFTATRDGDVTEGFQILPISNCPVTHPPGGWDGRRPIDMEVFAELFGTDPAFADDPFAFWRVPADMQRQDKFLGDTQGYGEQDDFYFEAKPRYGAVIPGQSGTPVFHGWPLGLTVRFDAFNYALPSVGGAVYWQGTIVNNSAEVYGEGITYDSLYIGLNYDPLMDFQRSAQYTDTKRGAILHNNTGTGCVGHVTPFSVCAQIANEGFAAGAAGIMFLKTPIGDMRNKLLTDPESPFFSPGHPAAGDTITFNHQHMCGFSGCPTATFSRSQRALFGLVSSTGDNVLDGRTAGELTQAEYFGTFRDEFWPTRTGQFNKYVPGITDDNPIWDYNKDGQPDTIYADSCGSKGCVGLWSDTLPGGFTMAYGNISFMSIGPFTLEPGDTVPLVMAFLGAPDSASIEATANNALDFYMRFFLGPEPAPAPVIVATNVTGGSTREAEITLFLDDRAESWRDPYLGSLNVGGELALNPGLDETLADLATNNVAAYHIFKSCDGGASFTSDGDCDGDPISDPTSKWSSFGWAPYETLEADADGELPNTYTDATITAGITYTYVVVTETRGATFNLVRSQGAGFIAEEVEFAPVLLSPLSASSTNPNVAVIYVPVNLASGAQNASFEITNRTGASDIPFEVDVVSNAEVGGTYRALFVDSMVVTETETLEDGVVTSRTTTVEGYLVRTVTGESGAERAIIQTFTFTRSGELPLSGFTSAAPTTSGSTRTTVSRGGDGMVLLNAQDHPLLATTTLTGDEATPGTFIGSADFPFYTVSFNNALGGTFNEQIFLTEEGDTIDAQVTPSVGYRTGSGQSAALPRSQFGTLEITWSDEPYGSSAPFRVTDRANLQQTFTASVTGREDTSVSSTDPALLEAIRAVAPSVPADLELVAYQLPFDVRNLTYGRDVQVVVTGHQETVLLGQGADTFRVAVPEGVWVPGDTMYFVETVTREVLDASGRTVLGPGGTPETETVTAATFRVILGCVAARLSCDPTIGGAQPVGYVAIEPGTKTLARYHTPIMGGEIVTFTVTPAVTTEDVATAGGAVDLDNVHVVPNPYIFASQYERSTGDRVIKFTNLPPDGRIRIYDIAGRFIQQIDYTAEELRGGDLDWNMRTREDLELAYGLYVFVLESAGQRKMGKFVIIR